MIHLLLLLALAASPASNADTLAAAVAFAQRSGTVTWVRWTVPSGIDGNACCWSGREGRTAQTCSLENDSYGMNVSDDNGVGSDPDLEVYARVSDRGIDRLRVFSNSCKVDPGSARVQEVKDVGPAESVRYLEGLVRDDGGRATKRLSDSALSAIALHDDKSADGALERLGSEGATKQIRHGAAFWLGNTRGEAGYEALSRLRSSGDAEFRDHLTFAFSQNRSPRAQVTLIDMARSDPSPRVRGQALFWIAQKAQKKADADVIRAAAHDDPDAEVKKKAVFALSQIPAGEGVPDLIRVAQENKSREVRKQAMFWLGQSKDPRALAFFEKILSQ